MLKILLLSLSRQYTVDGQYIPSLFIEPEVRHDKTSYIEMSLVFANESFLFHRGCFLEYLTTFMCSAPATVCIDPLKLKSVSDGKYIAFIPRPPPNLVTYPPQPMGVPPGPPTTTIYLHLLCRKSVCLI